jgi:N-methylhydantoinase A
MEALGRQELIKEGVEPAQVSLLYALDMRYVGQSHELTVPVSIGGDAVTVFHNAHKKRFGHQYPDEPVEIVNVRVTARGALAKPQFPAETPGQVDASAACVGQKRVLFGPTSAVETQLFQRDRLHAGNVIDGPAVIFQLDTTTVISPGWQARVDLYNTLIITRLEEQGANEYT